MAVNLIKGQKVSLKKSDGSAFHHIMVGLGWDPAETTKGLFSKFFQQTQSNIDCDASAFLLQNDHLVNNRDIVFFNNLKHDSKAVRHMGDNLTGEGEGDDEQIYVDLDKVPEDYNKIIFVVNIYQAMERRQHFGMIRNAFIRIVDNDTRQEFCRFNLSDDFSHKTALICGEIYRHNGEWKFNAIGQGTTDNSVGALSMRYR